MTPRYSAATSQLETATSPSATVAANTVFRRTPESEQVEHQRGPSPAESLISPVPERRGGADTARLSYQRVGLGDVRIVFLNGTSALSCRSSSPGRDTR